MAALGIGRSLALTGEEVDQLVGDLLIGEVFLDELLVYIRRELLHRDIVVGGQQINAVVDDLEVNSGME
jgi:hypothetical protein